MENPYRTYKDCVYYLDEKLYNKNSTWEDVEEFEVCVEGYHLIICTLTITTGYHCNIGFRLVDESNQPLLPYRTKAGQREVVHFTYEPCTASTEDQTPMSFHMIAFCKNTVKLQCFMVTGAMKLNVSPVINSHDRPWNHKSISTMSAIPLCGIEEQKNNADMESKGGKTVVQHP